MRVHALLHVPLLHLGVGTCLDTTKLPREPSKRLNITMSTVKLARSKPTAQYWGPVVDVRLMLAVALQRASLVTCDK